MKMVMQMRRLYCVIFLILMLVVQVVAQDISELRVVGKGELLPKELIDKNIRDANGEICAGLMVMTDLEALSFDSFNQIVKLNIMPGQYLLFLSPDERFVKVYKTGYKPLEIVLNDYGINLRSGAVHKLEITGRKKADLIPVTVQVRPYEGRLYVDDSLRIANTTFTLPAGKHIIRIEKEGFYSALDTIYVSNTKAFFSYSLKLMEDLPVQINSTPSGARIIIDGKDMGETNSAVYLFPGKYKLKLTRPDCLERIEDITVSETARNVFSFGLVRNDGKLKLTVDPADAKVLIDRKDYSGQSVIDLASGKHKLQIERPGYNSYMEVINIDFGTVTEKHYQLVPRTGRLYFTIQPYEAEVKLIQQGREIRKWQGLNTLNDLPEGEYDLLCVYEGFTDYKQKILIEEDKSVKVDVLMTRQGGEKGAETAMAEEKKGGIPWYYYVGGAVLTGGTAAILLLKKGSPTQNEKQIDMPPDRP